MKRTVEDFIGNTPLVRLQRLPGSDKNLLLAKLEGNTPAGSVKEVTIAAPMLEILRSITAVADDLRWLPFGGSYGGATTLVSEITVGGTKVKA